MEHLSIFGFLLVMDKIKEGIGFWFNTFFFQYVTDLSDKQIDRTAIENQVMYVHQQMDSLRGLYNFEPVERCLLQIERADEIFLVNSKLVVTHGTHRYFYGEAGSDGLDDTVFLCLEIYTHFRMATDDLTYCLGQLVCIGSFRISKQARNVVDGRERILQAIEVDTGLCV